MLHQFLQSAVLKQRKFSNFLSRTSQDVHITYRQTKSNFKIKAFTWVKRLRSPFKERKKKRPRKISLQLFFSNGKMLPKLCRLMLFCTNKLSFSRKLIIIIAVAACNNSYSGGGKKEKAEKPRPRANWLLENVKQKLCVKTQWAAWLGSNHISGAGKALIMKP